MVKEINLHSGLVALVDDADYERVAAFVWRSNVRGRTIYAINNPKSPILPKAIYMHRIVLDVVDAPQIEVDHINHNGLDNRRINLRACSHAENSRNRLKWIKPTTSAYKGVHFSRTENVWVARIFFNRRTIFLGRFISSISAAEAYNKAARKFFGKFANLNTLPSDINLTHTESI